MQAPIKLDQLDDRAALFVLARLGLELRGELDDEEAALVQDEAGARQILAAVAGQVAGDLNQPEPVTNLPGDLSAGAAAREILAVLSLDESLRPRLEALISQPPRHGAEKESQVKAYPIILNTVAAWLLTRVSIQEDEQGQFHAELASRKADLEVIRSVVKATLAMWMKLG